MSSLSATVGRGGTNRRGDVVLVQELLNRHPMPPLAPLKVDGSIGPKTIAAIEEFQRRKLKMGKPDGRVDPNGMTIHALSGVKVGRNDKPFEGLPGSGGGGTGLAEADFERAAKALRCEVAAIKAVTEVESGKSGFFASGRPKILFEAHIFSRLTKRKYDSAHPDISSPKWNRSLYAGGEKEYDRLERAMALDRDAALQSASWGRFQIMGFHYAKVGFPTADAFVKAMYKSEGQHLDAFIKFLESAKLDSALREKRWADFAKGYNGSGYATNKYDVKLKAAYEKHSKPKGGSVKTLP